MEESNPPSAEKPATEDGLRLASRGLRLGGSLLDALIIGAIIFPIYYVTGAWQTTYDAAKRHEMLPLGFTLMWMVIGLAIFVMLQGYSLVKNGQTLGKKLVYTRIVTMDGTLPSVRQLCVRYGMANYVGTIPLIGKFLALADICLIFRRDKRCGHDLAAGTQVIDVFEGPRE